MLEGFLEPNLDELNLDFVALLRGTSSIASTTTSPSAAGAGLGTGKAQRDGGDIFITSDYLYIHM